MTKPERMGKVLPRAFGALLYDWPKEKGGKCVNHLRLLYRDGIKRWVEPKKEGPSWK